jgi:hypothetical protein
MPAQIHVTTRTRHTRNRHLVTSRAHAFANTLYQATDDHRLLTKIDTTAYHTPQFTLLLTLQKVEQCAFARTAFTRCRFRE